MKGNLECFQLLFTARSDFSSSPSFCVCVIYLFIYLGGQLTAITSGLVTKKLNYQFPYTENSDCRAFQDGHEIMDLKFRPAVLT